MTEKGARVRRHTRKFASRLVLVPMAFALGAVALAGSPGLARADEPTREVRHDPSAYPPPSTQLPLVATGAATTAVWYGLALGGSYLYPTARGADELKIPIAGPWMSLAKTGCPETTPDCQLESGRGSAIPSAL